LVAIASFCIAASSAFAQVIQHVPADALVVVKVNNLKGVSDKIAALAQKFGVAQFLPPLMDPLASLEQNLKITQGINSSGDAAVALLDPEKYGAQNQCGVLLIPVTDYKAFLDNFSRPTEASDKPAPDNATQPTTQAAPVPDAQGIAAIAFPNAFETAYIAQWGDYAAISKLRPIVATPGTGLTVTGLAGKEMTEKDVVVYANMPAIKVKALSALKTNRQKILDEINHQLAMSHNPAIASMQSMAHVMVDLALDDAQRLLEDSQAATYGISIGQSGIRTTVLAEFMPDSPIGQSVAQLKNSDQSMMAGLPQEKYLFYGGIQWDPQAVGQLFDQVIGPVRTELAKAPDKPTQLVVQMIDLYRKILTSMQSQAVGWIPPSGPIGQSGLFNMLSVMTGDAAAMLDTQKAMLNLQPQLAESGNGPSANLKWTTSYAENAKQIDGVSFNQFNMKFDMTAVQTPDQRRVAQMMSMMYGPNGMTGLVGIVDAKHLVSGIGTSDEMMTQAIEAVKANQDPLGAQPALKDVTANLPTQRIGAFYVPLDQIAVTAAGYARQFGMPLNLQLPPNLAPIGMTAGTEQSAIRLDSFIPTQTVQSLIAAGMQAYMAAQGGAGGGL
jgi:hypothetical protein